MNPLSLLHGGKTIVAYCFHVYDRNVRFFMRHGLMSDPLVDYHVVQNMPEWPLGHPIETQEKFVGVSTLTWTKKPNIANDWGAYSYVARQVRKGDTYDFLICLNSTMRGPFFPRWNTSSWTSMYTSMLNNVVALAGASINPHNQSPHVQSMLMVMDQRAIDLYCARGTFLAEDKIISKDNLIDQHEVAGSTLILHAGYNIDCMFTAFMNRDWRKPQPDLKHIHDMWYVNAYFGRNIHPYETIFVKTNRSNAEETYSNITAWWEEVEHGPSPLLKRMDKPSIPSQQGEILTTVDIPLEYVTPTTHHAPPTMYLIMTYILAILCLALLAVCAMVSS